MSHLTRYPARSQVLYNFRGRVCHILEAGLNPVRQEVAMRGSTPSRIRVRPVVREALLIAISGLEVRSVELPYRMRMGPTTGSSRSRQPAAKMIRLIQLYLMVFAATAYAQTSGIMHVQLEVLPRVLTVSVNSRQVNFAQQRADAGVVTLDPTTGYASHKASGAHALGEVVIQGPAQAGFLVSMDHVTPLRRIGSRHEINFSPFWAQSNGCNEGAFVGAPVMGGSVGALGRDGCAMLRFGGTLHLFGVAEGTYSGELAVRIAPL